ncbi:MAG TPA: type II toxin-antitoxin system RelE/ParE family toxin [Clostridia bacterium]|nr:type II toxin-antitoxin system RelE/ParE family toxin [Clostridia bacterium]
MNHIVESRRTVQELEAIFYDKPDGTQPAKDFLNSLDIKMQAKMARTIQILQDNGTALREPYSKLLEDGIFELRAKVGSDISRVLYFFFVGKKVILTNGFIKKTQKTPKAEIERARGYRDEFLNRKESK